MKKAAQRVRRMVVGSPTPRVVMTLLCRNEADIVAHHVAFHLAMGVDFVIAMDNASDDNTAELLRHFERMGRLRLLHQPARNFDQGTWVTSMARTAQQDHGADWVINSDTDEFWWPNTGNLKTALGALPAKVNIVVAERANVRPAKTDGPPFYESMLVRELVSEKFRGGPLEPKVAHRASSEVQVRHGNHSATLGDQKLVHAPRGTIQILHYPTRSYAQWARRIAEGAKILDEHPDHPQWVTAGWRHMREHHLETGSLRDYFERLAVGPDEIDLAPDRANLMVDVRVRDVIRANLHLLPALSGAPAGRS